MLGLHDLALLEFMKLLFRLILFLQVYVYCISVLFVMHLKVMFPNKESSQNSPLQNDTVTKHLMLCMHNISAHIISVCNRGGRQSSNEKKREPRQAELVYCCVFIDQQG